MANDKWLTKNDFSPKKIQKLYCIKKKDYFSEVKKLILSQKF